MYYIGSGCRGKWHPSTQAMDMGGRCWCLWIRLGCMGIIRFMTPLRYIVATTIAVAVATAAVIAATAVAHPPLFTLAHLHLPTLIPPFVHVSCCSHWSCCCHYHCHCGCHHTAELLLQLQLALLLTHLHLHLPALVHIHDCNCSWCCVAAVAATVCWWCSFIPTYLHTHSHWSLVFMLAGPAGSHSHFPHAHLCLHHIHN